MMSLTTLGIPMGFLEAANDVERIIRGTHRNSKYLGLVCFPDVTRPFELEEADTCTLS